MLLHIHVVWKFSVTYQPVLSLNSASCKLKLNLSSIFFIQRTRAANVCSPLLFVWCLILGLVVPVCSPLSVILSSKMLVDQCLGFLLLPRWLDQWVWDANCLFLRILRINYAWQQTLFPDNCCVFRQLLIICYFGCWKISFRICNSGITIEISDNLKNENHHNILYCVGIKPCDEKWRDIGKFGTI
jgi:hypothetical protein